MTMHKLESLTAAQVVIDQTEDLIRRAENSCAQLTDNSVVTELLRINTELNTHNARMLAPLYYAANNGGVPSKAAKDKTFDFFGYKISHRALPQLIYRTILLIVALMILAAVTHTPIVVNKDGFSVGAKP